VSVAFDDQRLRELDGEIAARAADAISAVDEELTHPFTQMVKLTYEQMRRLSELGEDGGALNIKNRHGETLKPALKKWGNPYPTTGYTSMMVRQRPSRAPLASPSQTYPRRSSSQRRRPRAKR
jgi:hypothetical protein